MSGPIRASAGIRVEKGTWTGTVGVEALQTWSTSTRAGRATCSISATRDAFGAAGSRMVACPRGNRICPSTLGSVHARRGFVEPRSWTGVRDDRRRFLMLAAAAVVIAVPGDWARSLPRKPERSGSRVNLGEMDQAPCLPPCLHLPASMTNRPGSQASFCASVLPSPPIVRLIACRLLRLPSDCARNAKRVASRGVGSVQERWIQRGLYH